MESNERQKNSSCHEDFKTGQTRRVPESKQFTFLTMQKIVTFCFKQFLNLAGQWAYLKNSAIVRLFGITLAGQISMVMDFAELGPLDRYLRTNVDTIETVDLVEASANLASALWHLVRRIVLILSVYSLWFS